MQHLSAFSFASTNSGVGTFVPITAVQDFFLSISPSGRFMIPSTTGGGGLSNYRILGGFAGGTTMTVARIQNAYLRRIALPSITPVNPGLTSPSLFNIAWFGRNGPQLPYADEFGVEADATAIERQTAFLWLGDGNNNIGVGEIFPVQFSATITTVANAWTQGTISFGQVLNVGRYQVVGMDVIGTTLLAARLAFNTGGNRPGILARAALSAFPSNQFRVGNSGSFGEFSSLAPPFIEVFDSAAGSVTFTGYLDLIKVG